MSFKKFLPVENYTLTTKLSVEEVRIRIDNNTEAKKNFRFFSGDSNSAKAYEGHITGNRFTISRVIGYRNSFLPIITGDISSFAGQSQIKIKMRLQPFALIFIVAWLSIVGIVCSGIVIGQILQVTGKFTVKFSPMLFIPFAMFIFGCLLTYFAFNKERNIAKQFLARLLEGKEGDPQ